MLDVGETKQFSFTATGNNYPTRYNDATIVKPQLRQIGNMFLVYA